MSEKSPLEKFHRAWFAPRLRLLGFDCAPFCFGHYLIFQAVGLPFERLGEPEVWVDSAELLLSLRIASESRWPFQTLPTHRHTEREKKIHRRLSRWPGALRRAIEIFTEWLLECSEGPELWREVNEDFRPLTAPAVLSMTGRLMFTGAFSEERVFSMPIGLGRFYLATKSELEGGASFLTEEDLAAIRHSNSQPDPNTLDDDALFAMVREQLGDEGAQNFMEARRAHAAGNN